MPTVNGPYARIAKAWGAFQMVVILSILAFTILATVSIFMLDIATILWIHDAPATNGFWQMDPIKMWHVAEYVGLGSIWGLGGLAVWLWRKDGSSR